MRSKLILRPPGVCQSIRPSSPLPNLRPPALPMQPPRTPSPPRPPSFNSHSGGMNACDCRSWTRLIRGAQSGEWATENARRPITVLFYFSYFLRMLEAVIATSVGRVEQHGGKKGSRSSSGPISRLAHGRPSKKLHTHTPTPTHTHHLLNATGAPSSPCPQCAALAAEDIYILFRGPFFPQLIEIQEHLKINWGITFNRFTKIINILI